MTSSEQQDHHLLCLYRLFRKFENQFSQLSENVLQVMHYKCIEYVTAPHSLLSVLDCKRSRVMSTYPMKVNTVNVLSNVL